MCQENLSSEAPKFLNEKMVRVLAPLAPLVLATMACNGTDIGLGAASIVCGAMTGIFWSEAFLDGVDGRIFGGVVGAGVGALLYSEIGSATIAGEAFFTAMYFLTKGGEGLKNLGDRLDQWIQRRESRDTDVNAEEQEEQV